MSDLISRQDAIDAIKAFLHNDDDWFQEAAASQIRMIPSADRPTGEEDQLKFYYVESIDDYWVGRRLDNFYYANWHEGLGFIWSHSRYLPWGEHVVDENTLWKEHTYPSEPIEIPFTEWVVGFVNKYFADRQEVESATIHNEGITFSYRKTGEWEQISPARIYECSECGQNVMTNDIEAYKFCHGCGAKMGGES